MIMFIIHKKKDTSILQKVLMETVTYNIPFSTKRIPAVKVLACVIIKRSLDVSVPLEI